MDFFDLHCDTLTHAHDDGASIKDGWLQITLDKARALGRYAQCFAVYIRDSYRGDAAWDYFDSIYKFFRSELERYPEKWEQVQCGVDIDRIAGEGRIAAILTIEGGAALGGKMERLAELKRRGVKMMTLTWNGENEIGFGMPQPEKGLKPFGKELLHEMEKVGMVIDISHLSDAGVHDVFKEITGPVAASHSNSRAVCGHGRNLSDEFFSEIVRRGGIVGMNFYKDFVDNDPQKADMEGLARHIEHFLELGGENTVCMGSDFDGCDTVPGLEHIGKTQGFYTYLKDSGFDDETLKKIFWQNAHDFMASRI